jgi:hypothetical protein
MFCLLQKRKCLGSAGKIDEMAFSLLWEAHMLTTKEEVELRESICFVPFCALGLPDALDGERLLVYERVCCSVYVM